MTEQENRIIEELRKNWHEWDFDEKMLFILSKIKEAEDRKVEEIVELLNGAIKDTDSSYAYGEGTLEGIMHSKHLVINSLKQ
jgi:hypothetical protein